jgi:DNA-binding MarR family transcriptional regulator
MRTTKTLAASDAAGPPFGGTLAQEHITVLLVSIGMRLNRGATAYYRAAWDLGMAEWRLLLVLSSTKSLNVGELSEVADLDKAAISPSLSVLGERKLVSVEQTRTRTCLHRQVDGGGKETISALDAGFARTAGAVVQRLRPRRQGTAERTTSSGVAGLADADWEH